MNKNEMMMIVEKIFGDDANRVRVNMSGGKASPHKICMLLALLDLARGGALKTNKIEYE